MPEKSSKQKLIFTILGGVVLYLLSAGISYATFRYLGTSVTISPISPVPTGQQGHFRVDLGAPKTEICPTNGGMFTQEEKKIWEQHRPITVMIENHADARPQSGLSRADVIYEAVAEGGITRFLAVYLCEAAKEDVTLAPVRSSRIYFIYWASEYGKAPMYVHVGGANNFSGSGDTAKEVRALEFLQEIRWRYRGGNDLDPTYDGQFPVFWRNYDRLDKPAATEHTMVSTTDKIWDEAHKRSLDAVDEKGISWDQDFIQWKFKDEAETDGRGTVTNIKFSFWSGHSDYDVDWQYDKDNNYFLRFNDGQAQKDLNNDEQLKAKVVVVQFTKERGPLDANKHLLYTTLGKGKAVVFQDGQAIEASWEKVEREDRTRFYNAKGKEIAFNRGQVWIEIVPVGKEINY